MRRPKLTEGLDSSGLISRWSFSVIDGGRKGFGEASSAQMASVSRRSEVVVVISVKVTRRGRLKVEEPGGLRAFSSIGGSRRTSGDVSLVEKVLV